MLSVIEKFIGPIRRVANDNDALVVLKQIADHFGYRSAVLVEYEPSLTRARRLLDTDPQRQASWPELFRTKGLGRGVDSIREMLRKDNVVRLHPERFGPGDLYHEFSERYGLNEGTGVPISQSDNIAGIVAFYGGDVALKRSDELALQLLSYSLFSELRQKEKQTVATTVPTLPPLTPREREVMRLSAIGLTSVEIADQLGMSPRTVNQHVDNVADKLGTKNRTHTIAELMRHDMLK